MKIWQADFYRRPLQDPTTGQPLWELVVCDSDGTFAASGFCLQSEANSLWIAEQLKRLMSDRPPFPDRIQVFRPQAVSLIEAACRDLGVTVEPTRRTFTLKQVLRKRAEDYRGMDAYTKQSYEPVALEQPPPVPIPETLWGERWRFAAIAAGDLEPMVQGRPIPIVEMPEAMRPMSLKLASTVPIPGVVIDGGRQSMRLARWLQQTNPVALNYIPGAPDGLILEAGLVDRWVLATFDDSEVVLAARTFQQRQQASQGLHFLLVQPDDSGITYSGFWLLKAEA